MRPFSKVLHLIAMGRLSETVVDPETVAAARGGDAAARETLFNAVAGNAFGLIRRIVRHKALAEDLLQDTLIAMYEHLEQFRDEVTEEEAADVASGEDAGGAAEAAGVRVA